MRNRTLALTIGALAAAAAVAGCAPGYVSAGAVWTEPAGYYYAEPMDRVVVVTQDVLVERGYTIVRVEQEGPQRIIWARRGDDDMVRVFARPEGDRIALRGLEEHQDRGKHKGWERRGNAPDVLADIDTKMRGHGQGRGNDRH